MTLQAVAVASAQTPGAAAPTTKSSPKKKYPKGFVPGTPLDTLMKSHLTTTVPEAKDFVRESRPDAKALDYTPLSGESAPDPDRPKPRDKANVEALQAELERDGARNARRAQGLAPARASRHRSAAPP